MPRLAARALVSFRQWSATPPPGFPDDRHRHGRVRLLADGRALEREDPARTPATAPAAARRQRASWRSPTPTSRCRSSECEALEYMDWKSGGDTNFAPIASADGELDCRGFWDKGKTDKDALWTSNADARRRPCASYVDAVGANFGRVRVIKLEPQDRATRRSARSTATTTTASTPTTRAGWCARGSSSPTTPTATCC